MNRRPKSSFQWNRRDFIKTTSIAAGALAFGVPALLRGKNLNSRLNIACIGAMGRGENDTDCCNGENIVALCDVDLQRCAGQRMKYAQSKFYQDFRRMFDEMGSIIDAVTISTPDHFHAIAASAAMQSGRHVYCQKPLTQTIYEARYLRNLAGEKKIVTQMGNQGSAEDGLRRAVECVQDGLIGRVRQIHVWTNRPVWPQGIGRPEGEDPIPATLDWDIWIGPAPMRPFKKDIYHPFNWRGWQDFGTGALGDMACHTVNMPFRALRLGYPAEIEAECFGALNRETYPIGSKIRFEFPARKAPHAVPMKGAELLMQRDLISDQPPVTLWWYDGGRPLADNPARHDGSNKPSHEVTAGIEALQGGIPGSGCLLIGDDGRIFSPGDYGERFFVKLNGEKKFIHYKNHPAVKHIPQSVPRNKFNGDADRRHHLEWIAAIKNNDPELCYSRFEIGAQLTEIMLLGCVALRAGRKIEWDGANMRAKNCPEAAPFIKRDNRSGWFLS